MGDVHHPLDITRALEVWGTGGDPLTSDRIHSSLSVLLLKARLSNLLTINLTIAAGREVTQVTESRFPTKQLIFIGNYRTTGSVSNTPGQVLG
jgi:hypothetical protein